MTGSAVKHGMALAGFLALTLLWSPVSLGGTCKGNRYQVSGSVRNASVRPAADARVWVLLDKASKKQFVKHGMRAKSFTTDKSGNYLAMIVCGTRPDPCARNVKHLTVAVTDRLGRTKMKVFRFDQLAVSERAGECFVRVPEVSFSH